MPSSNIVHAPLRRFPEAKAGTSAFYVGGGETDLNENHCFRGKRGIS